MSDAVAVTDALRRTGLPSVLACRGPVLLGDYRSDLTESARAALEFPQVTLITWSTF